MNEEFYISVFSPSWWAIAPQVPLRINCWTLGAVTESQVTTIFFPHAALTIFYILSQNSLLSNAYVLLGSWKEWSSVNTHTHTTQNKQKKQVNEHTTGLGSCYSHTYKLPSPLANTLNMSCYRTATAVKNEGQGWSPETSGIPRQQTHPLWH